MLLLLLPPEPPSPELLEPSPEVDPSGDTAILTVLLFVQLRKEGKCEEGSRD
jgi:hypothetical protein